MSEIKLHLSDWIQKECKRRRISLSKMAEKSGVGKSTLYDWSVGANPKLDNKTINNLKRLADYFDISIVHLIFGGFTKEQESDVLFESVFKDGTSKYRLKIEKILE